MSSNKTPKTKSSKPDGLFETNVRLEAIQDFVDFKLKDELLRGVFAYGWESPSPIQARAISPMISGKDLIAQAQSGTGKSGAFLISSLQAVDAQIQATQALILAPARELAKQIADVAQNLASHMKIDVHLSIGGTNRREDQRILQAGPQLVIGTPGRINDHLSRGNLNAKQIRCLCLDEADQMLSQGFEDAMYDIFQYMPSDIQVCLFSATMPQEILKLSEKFMRDPVSILVKAQKLSLDGIAQYKVEMEEESWKLETLFELYKAVSIPQVVIFCNSKTRVEQLADKMNQSDFTVSYIHGGLNQDERSLRMKEFRSGASRVLITTDLLARGIDVYNVQMVINYDFGKDIDNYIHRVGRSGRFGKKGIAINFVNINSRDTQWLEQTEVHYNTTIVPLPQNLEKVFGAF